MGIVSSTLCRGEGVQVSAPSMSPSNGDDDAENWNEFHISLSNDELERCFPDTGIVDMEDEVEWDEVFDELSEQHLMLDSSVESSRSNASQSVFDGVSSWQSESAEDFSVGIIEVLEAVEAAEIIADLSTSREVFSAFDDGTRCAECNREFDSEGLVWKIHYNNCASCSVSICPACYLVVPLMNGKMCGCCGKWHCDNCYHLR